MNTTLDNIAATIHAFRLFQRGVLVVYMWGGWAIAEWFMALTDPSGAQSVFVSTYAGIFPLLLGAYGYTRPKIESGGTHIS